MSDTLTADGKAKKKSKITKLAKSAALAGGLDWATLTKAQRRELKQAVRADRAAGKLAKKGLGAPATNAADAPLALTSSDTKRVVLTKAAKDPADAMKLEVALRDALAHPHDGDGWRA